MEENKSGLFIFEFIMRKVSVFGSVCLTTLLLLVVNYYGLWKVGPTALFSYHLLFMSMFVACCSSAILLVSQNHHNKVGSNADDDNVALEDNVINPETYQKRKSRHIWLQASAVLFGLTGFLVIFANKLVMGKRHIQTLHSTFGLISLIFALGAALFALFVRSLSTIRSSSSGGAGNNTWRSKIRKIFWLHRVGGYVTMMLILVTVGLAFDSDWARIAIKSEALRICMISGLVCQGLFITIQMDWVSIYDRYSNWQRQRKGVTAI